ICNGECPKNRFSEAPDGDPGLNYLCAGYKAFFKHADKPMRIMAELVRANRPASEVMAIVAGDGGDSKTRFASTGRNDPCPCGSGVKFKKCHGHPVVEKRPSTPLLVYEPIKIVRQEHADGCSIATAAMVAGTSYRETLAAIGTMSTSEESAAIYMPREGKFLNDRD